MTFLVELDKNQVKVDINKLKWTLYFEIAYKIHFPESQFKKSTVFSLLTIISLSKGILR